MDTYYGIKHQTSQVWDSKGKRLAVTKIKAKPVVVTQVKTAESDGYHAIQLAIHNNNRPLNKPLSGHLKPSHVSATPRFVREVRLNKASEHKVGDKIAIDQVLSPGDIVYATGTSKGRGFTGVVKRWGFAGGPKTHGQSDRQRAPGSIGQGTDPGRVHKGKKMPGRSGNQTITVKNLKVVYVDPDGHEIWVSGTVPGSIGSLITLNKRYDGEFKGLHSNSTPNKESQQKNPDKSGDKKDKPERSDQTKKTTKDASSSNSEKPKELQTKEKNNKDKS